MDDSEHSSKFVRSAGIVVGLVVIAGLLLALVYQAIAVFFLLFAAIVLSVLLRGLAELLAEYTPIPVRLALALILLTLVGIVTLIVFVSGPNIVEQSERVQSMVPKALAELDAWLEQSPLGGLLPERPKLEETLGGGKEVMSRLMGIFSGAFGVLGNSLVVLAVGIYLSIDPDRYKRGFVRLFPPGYRDRATDIIEETSTQLARWLGGRAITMTAVGILTSAGLWLLDVPLALFLGVLTGLLTFVPVIGPIISAAPAMLMGLLNSPHHVLYVGALYLGIQSIENYLLTPLIGEKSVHIPPALLLLAQVLLAVLTGLLGIILATPLLVMSIVVIERAYIEDVLGDTSS